MGVLEQLRQVELIFGQGRGWHRIEELFGTTWRNLETPFDKKGSNSGHVHEHLLFADTSLPESRRRILVYWWKPNRDGSPLCFLSQAEGRLLGRQIREHASGIAPGLQLLRPA